MLLIGLGSGVTTISKSFVVTDPTISDSTLTIPLTAWSAAILITNDSDITAL